MTAGTAEVVIATKLSRPGPRQHTVERKRLHDLLRQGNTRPLTLVVAPAGWGKSTLVVDWLARDSSVGVADNEVDLTHHGLLPGGRPPPAIACPSG